MIEIPARKGKATRVKKGQTVKVINSKGQQVVDTWAFSAGDLYEFMSMEHSRVAIGRIIPGIGDALTEIFTALGPAWLGTTSVPSALQAAQTNADYVLRTS